MKALSNFSCKALRISTLKLLVLAFSLAATSRAQLVESFYLSPPASPVFESDGVAKVTIWRRNPTDAERTISFVTEEGTAKPGVNYVHTAGSVTFAAGERFRSIEVPLIDNAEDMDGGRFTVRLLSGGLYHRDTSCVIHPQDDEGSGYVSLTPTGAWLNSPIFVAEDQVFAQISLFRQEGLEGTLEVVVRTSDGTARADEDYLPVDRVVSFPPGIRQTTISVRILNDFRDEPNETFRLSLLPKDGIPWYAQTSVNLSINGADDPLPYRFKTTSSRISEGAGVALVTIERIAEEAEPMNLMYEVRPGTAQPKSDVNSSWGTIVFEPGSTETTIAIELADSAEIEVDETFTVHLWGNHQATDETHTVTIIDDDHKFPRQATYFTVFERGPATLTVTVQANGAITGVLKGIFETYRFRGRLSADGEFFVRFNSPLPEPPSLRLRPVFDGASLEGEWNGESFFAARTERSSKKGRLGKAGVYNAILDTRNGFVSAAVAPSGRVQLRGLLKGRVIALTAQLNRNHVIEFARLSQSNPFYAFLRLDSTSRVVTGELADWPTRPQFSGMKFSPRAEGRLLDDFDATKGQGWFGGLRLHWNRRNEITVQHPEFKRLTVNHRTGILRGSFSNSGRKLSLRGICIQRPGAQNDTIEGLFVSKGQHSSGSFTIFALE